MYYSRLIWIYFFTNRQNPSIQTWTRSQFTVGTYFTSGWIFALRTKSMYREYSNSMEFRFNPFDFFFFAYYELVAPCAAGCTSVCNTNVEGLYVFHVGYSNGCAGIRIYTAVVMIVNYTTRDRPADSCASLPGIGTVKAICFSTFSAPTPGRMSYREILLLPPRG